jgi:hypothetical protein
MSSRENQRVVTQEERLIELGLVEILKQSKGELHGEKTINQEDA